jgi:hypothetical protein
MTTHSSTSCVIPITVTVYHIVLQGNSPSGRFLFLFSEDVAHVSKRNTEIQYNLSDDSIERGIRFIGYFSSDSHDQLGPIDKMAPTEENPTKSIRLCHTNDSESLLVNVSLHVTDIRTRTRGACDPQITNSPDPHS